MLISGHDSWTTEKAVSYFKRVMKIAADLGVYVVVLNNSIYPNNRTNPLTLGANVVHETHRQRLLYNPYQAREILSKPELEGLKINCDLSHWVAVCEHVFDGNDPNNLIHPMNPNNSNKPNIS